MANRSNKPSWVKSNEPLELKILIWREMAIGRTIKEVELWLDTQKDAKGNQMHLDRDTIGVIRNELKYVPKEIVNNMPIEVQLLWKDLNKGRMTEPAQTGESLRRQLYVEKVVPLLSCGWGLKISNNTDIIAENCAGTLEIIEEVNSEPKVSGNWSDLLASRRFRWDDTESIPIGASAIMRVINIEYPIGIPAGTEANCYSLAYKEVNDNSYLIPQSLLLLLISITAKGFNPTYILCSFLYTKFSQRNNLMLIAGNLKYHPSFEESMRIFMGNTSNASNNAVK